LLALDGLRKSGLLETGNMSGVRGGYHEFLLEACIGMTKLMTGSILPASVRYICAFKGYHLRFSFNLKHP
jgi:hypothetical protein